MDFLAALAKVLPVFLLILLGVLLRRLQFLAPETVNDLKRIVVNVTLPSALFLAFSTVQLRPAYLIIAAIVFAACLLVYLLARPLGRAMHIPSPYFHSLLTGFEAGMMGYAIYSAVYGQENIYKFGIIDLGQVLFVFFVLVPGLQRMGTEATSFGSTLAGFVRTPVILAIGGGLAFQALGLTDLFKTQPMLDGVLEAVRLLAAMTTPLVAVLIGYQLYLQPGALTKPVVTVLVRLAIWVPAGLIFAHFVIGGWLGLDTDFQAAALTMVLLPAPFVIPIFMRDDGEAERSYILNTLTIGIVFTLITYAFVPLLFPPG